MRSVERWRVAWRALVPLIVGLGAWLAAPGHPALGASSSPAAGGSGSLDIRGALGGAAAEGFARAMRVREFEFPADHGPHPRFRSEWWYLTLNLRDADDRPAGAQFTLFRQALAPPAEDATPTDESLPTPDGGVSAWRTRQVWMAHVAVTTPDGEHFAAERLVRDALGLGGVTAAPFTARLEDWRLASIGEAFAPLELDFSAEAEGTAFALDVRLDPGRPLVLQGEDGLSRKGEREGNASYYYSFTRLPASGTLVAGDRSWKVTGAGWLDREWSTSVLEAGQSGWDWLALQLDDGRDLMIYRLRRDAGAAAGANDRSGVLIDADGTRTALRPGPEALEPIDHWTDEDGVAWPIAWRLYLPEHGIDGRVRAVVDDQLDRLGVRYWEGLVCLEGSARGCGYLELTGYGSDREN